LVAEFKDSRHVGLCEFVPPEARTVFITSKIHFKRLLPWLIQGNYMI
jgi:hypothetical protein